MNEEKERHVQTALDGDEYTRLKLAVALVNESIGEFVRTAILLRANSILDSHNNNLGEEND